MKEKSMNMGQGPVLGVLLKLGLPAMVSMFFQNLYNLVDTVFVSWLGTVELAALSLSIPLLYLVMSMAKGLAVGTTALVSHARGSNEPQTATRTIASSLPLAVLVICPFCLIAFSGVNQWIFGLFHIEPQVLTQIHKFVFWLAFVFPAMGFTMICEGVFLSYGDAKTPMKAMIIGNLINIILDPFFIFVCEMGIAGASLSSFIGWAVAGIIMWTALKRQGKDRPGLIFSREHFKFWKSMAGAGGPVALAMMIIPFSLVGLNYVLAPFGPAYVGAWNLASRMEQMIVLPLFGLSCSLIPFAGFNLGAGNADRIRESVRIVFAVCYGVLVPAGLVLGVFAPDIIGLFNPGDQVLKLSSFALRTALLGYFLMPAELIMTGIAQGIKQPRFSLFINLLRLVCLRLPLAFVFGFLWGGRGAYVSHAVSMTITGLVSLYLLRRLMGMSDDACAGRKRAEQTLNPKRTDPS
jgi:putative MATE family efflux protein